MLRILDFNLCKDGYQVDNLNCIDLPIAAAARFFNYDYYHFYCLYYAFFVNWTGIALQPPLKEKILNKLGLSMKAYPIKNGSQLIEAVKYHIDQNHPILMMVKYNSLFYHHEYSNMPFNSDHAVIISGYDPERSLIQIRDCVITQKHIKPEVKADILFPLQLTMEMVTDIWKRSNQIYKKEKSFFYNSLFTIEKLGEPQITGPRELVKDLLSYDFQVRKFEDRMAAFNFQKDDKEIRNDFYNAVVMFFDGLEVIFGPLFKRNESWRNRFADFKKEFMEYRDALITKIIALILRGREPNDEDKSNILERISALESQLFILIQELSDAQEQVMSATQITEYVYLDLIQYFNNQGFGKDLPDGGGPTKSAARFSLKGSYLLPVGLPAHPIWEIHDLQFTFPGLGEQVNDNIVCDGQVIAIPKGRYSSIMLLGCGEQGYFTENLTVQYVNGAVETVTFQFSNFDNQPTFTGELVAWKGPWLKNKQGQFHKTYYAYLFARKHLVNPESELVQIKLPVCPNIHLFAITLGKLAS